MYLNWAALRCNFWKVGDCTEAHCHFIKLLSSDGLPLLQRGHNVTVYVQVYSKMHACMSESLSV